MSSLELLLPLQGLYNISRVIFWNRADGATISNRAIGATVSLLNANNGIVAQFTLGSGLIQQWFPITYFPPSATPSSTASPSTTPTPSFTGTGSPSSTGTPTSSLSPGVSVSATATMTASPLSPLPANLRLSLNGTCLHFLEVLVFSTSGKLLSSGAAATASSTFAVENGPEDGIDGCMAVDGAGLPVAPCAPVHTQCTDPQWWCMAFGPTNDPLYPTGYPTPVGSIYFVNRIDGNVGGRVTAGNGSIAMYRQDGSIAAGPLFPSAQLVSWWQVAPITLPAPAVTVAAATGDQLDTLVAAVRVEAAPAQYLNFREIMVSWLLSQHPRVVLVTQ